MIVLMSIGIFLVMLGMFLGLIELLLEKETTNEN